MDMIMSKKPSGTVLITVFNVPADFHTDSGRACRDALVTERVQQTEEGFADFLRRHGGVPAYPSLARYPRPHG